MAFIFDLLGVLLRDFGHPGRKGMLGGGACVLRVLKGLGVDVLLLYFPSLPGRALGRVPGLVLPEPDDAGRRDPTHGHAQERPGVHARPSHSARVRARLAASLGCFTHREISAQAPA